MVKIKTNYIYQKCLLTLIPEQEASIRSEYKKKQAAHLKRKMSMVWKRTKKLIQLDEELFKNFERYVDLVWKNRHTYVYFVEVQNTKPLDKLKDHISLFNIKTITNVCGVFNSIAWRLVEKQSQLFQAKVKEQRPDPKICSFLDRIHNPQFYPKISAEESLFLPIHAFCIDKMDQNFGKEVREMPVNFKYKIAFCVA
jgi:hypothetical protein